MFKLSFRDEEDRFHIDDVIAIVHRLGLDPDHYDHAYSPALSDYLMYSRNERVDMTLFYVTDANALFLSVVCKDAAVAEILAELFSEIRDAEAGQKLTYR